MSAVTDVGASGAPAGGEGQGAANGAASAPWSGLDAESSGWIQNKQFKDVGSLVKGYRELESFRGVPAERLLKLPEKEDDPGWADVHKRLGVPEKDEDYGVQGAAPELLAAMRKGGVSKRALAEILPVMQKIGETTAAQEEEARAQRSQLEEQELRREWGQEFDTNLKHAKSVAARVAAALGFPDVKAAEETFTKVEGAMGTKAFLKFMAFFGRGSAEPAFVERDMPTSGDGFGMTPDAAMSAFRALGNDVEFMKKLDAGDAASIAKYERLAKLAAPRFNAGGPQF